MKTVLRSALALGAAASLTLAGTPASAQQANNDARCFFVSNLFSKSTDPKAKQFATEAAFYYLGRLTTAGGPQQIERLLRVVGPTVTRANADATMNTCARAVADNAQQVRAIGQRLSQEQAAHK